MKPSDFSEIHLADSLAPGLQDLEPFSHVIVLLLMHELIFDLGTDLVRRPRGRSDLPLVRAFAQRAKHRPNPIGITTVQLLEVRGNVLRVKGLDAVDETPVFDLKPYMPVFDCRHEPKIPE